MPPCRSAWLAATAAAAKAQNITPAKVNLLANGTFEDANGAGANERLIPGCWLKFRGKGSEPALGDPRLPFIITQLCNWQTREPVHFQWTRDGQLRISRTVPVTALAVTIDLADKPGEGGHGSDGYGPGEIHPIRKPQVAHRNALAAPAIAYGEKVVYSGPIYESCKPRDNKLVLAFDSIGGGLVAKGDKLVGFSIAGEDRNFVPAEAAIEGSTVVLSSPSVAKPVAARYGFEQYVDPVCSLHNKDGLPASPFRTDDWPLK